MKMNKLDKIYTDFLGDAFSNYNENCNEDKWMKEINLNLPFPNKSYGQFSQEEFINKIKTDDEFAKSWGVTIETIELTENKRINLLHIKHGNKGHHIEAGFNMLDEFDIPTKLIRATYKNKTIESYE